MPNQFAFEGYFNKEDILELLDEGATDLIVTASLTYDATTGASKFVITAQRMGNDDAAPQTMEGCPRPCRETQPPPPPPPPIEEENIKMS